MRSSTLLIVSLHLLGLACGQLNDGGSDVVEKDIFGDVASDLQDFGDTVFGVTTTESSAKETATADATTTDDSTSITSAKSTAKKTTATSTTETSASAESTTTTESTSSTSSTLSTITSSTSASAVSTESSASTTSTPYSTSTTSSTAAATTTASTADVASKAASTTSTDSSSSSIGAGGIAAAVVLSVAALGSIAFVTIRFFATRRREARKEAMAEKMADNSDLPFDGTVWRPPTSTRPAPPTAPALQYHGRTSLERSAPPAEQTRFSFHDHQQTPQMPTEAHVAHAAAYAPVSARYVQYNSPPNRSAMGNAVSADPYQPHGYPQQGQHQQDYYPSPTNSQLGWAR